MSPEIGQLLLTLSMAAAFLQTLVGMGLIKLPLSLQDRLMMNLVAIHAIGLFSAMICLGYSFITDDFSVLYVALNSHTDLPVQYKVAAIWGAHEGSLLLWVFLLSIWGLLLALSKKFNQQTMDLKIKSLGFIGLISFGFIVFILYTSNPFERLFPIPVQGRSLNPLLQDPALVMHPPILYAGYVGLAVPFSLALASLITVKHEALQYQWAGIARVWTIAPWLFLTGGIALGSWWAYYELGWGGWWFWDPVENASLMPWLTATALVHSLIVTDQMRLFNAMSILLAIISFSLSLLGTFLVRSGILISVHSFASDPTRGMFILMLLGFFTGGALILYSLRLKKERRLQLKIFSRESLLLLNNVFLCTAAGLILIGTLYPLLVEIFNAGKLSVGPPYFNFVFLIPFLPMLFFMGWGAFSSWQDSELKDLISRTKWIFLSVILLSIFVTFAVYNYAGLLTLVGITLAGWTILTGATPFFKNLKLDRRNALKLLPMSLAHVGLGLTVLGITVTSTYGITFDKSLQFGQSAQVGNYEFKLIGISDKNGPNYTAKVAEVEITSNDNRVAIIYPEKRTYDQNSPALTEAGIESNLGRDLFVALGEDVGNQSWSLHLQYKPLLRLIWLGPFIMILGGLFRIYLSKPLARKLD
jgi:cytochrome c-type biogenesis protein CcmF